MHLCIFCVCGQKIKSVSTVIGDAAAWKTAFVMDSVGVHPGGGARMGFPGI